MKEKIMGFLQNEKVKRFAKRVVNKRTIIIAIVILVVVSALKISCSLMFEVKGTVKSIDGKSITIANFINTRTIDVGDYPIELKQIQVGDRVEITKNLSGDIINIKDEDRGHTTEKGIISGNGKQKSKGNEKNNHREKN